MYAIETNNLTKSFRGFLAVNNLNLKVPIGSIYGFIGENGSGKSTTQKLISGLLVKSGGEIKLFGKDYTDPGVRAKIGVMIENPACFPGSTVYQNLMMQALNLGIENAQDEVLRVLRLVNMESAATRKFKQCSLGMKQRIGVAQSLLGNPHLIIIDEPINGLDADGIRIVRETLLELNQKHGITILISSHILGELEKIATHYGIIRNGTLIKEMTADEMSNEWREFVFVKVDNTERALMFLKARYKEVETEDDGIRIYDEKAAENVAELLVKGGTKVKEIIYKKIGLEEYYIRLMSQKGVA
jgi:ABC-2 type transport system ATP-binding protein